MAQSAQVGNATLVANLTGIVHEIWDNKVLSAVRWESPTAQLMQEAGAGDFDFTGEALVGATDFQRATGAMGTGTAGDLPDGHLFDAVQWQVTPIRRYRRFVADNHALMRATGRGSFQDLGDRIFDQLWGSWRIMEIRHAVGDSNGVLCTIASRTSSTVVVVQNGYNHSGMRATIALQVDQDIAWLDSSNSNAVGGAGSVSAINYSTNAVTVTTAATWEPSPQTAANDLIVCATTTDSTADYFATEYQGAKNGLMTIVDPADANTTVFNISEATYERWNPYRVASGTFDHIEVTEFLQRLESKSTYPVTPDTHTIVLHPAAFAELARTLLGYQQQQNLGKTLEGGYQTVRVAGYDFVKDPYQLHNVMYALCDEDLFTVNLLEASYYDDDGSMWARLEDYDGQEGFVRDYCNSFSPRRNRHGALTGITFANVTFTDFDPEPVEGS